MTREIVVFDLDGTLSLTEHRVHHLKKDPPDWRAFYAACIDDEPNLPIVRLFNDLLRADEGFLPNYELWILTGRSAEVREQTEAWLAKHLQHYHRLIMRAEGDHTPDTKLKRRWIDEHGLRDQVAMVFEDRASVVKMWRDEGFTCLQVAPGDF